MFSRVSKSHLLKSCFYSLNLVAGKRQHFWKRHLIYFFKTCRSHFIILFLLKNVIVTSANGQRISPLSIPYGDCLWYNFTLMFLKKRVIFFHIYIKLHHTLHLPTHQYVRKEDELQGKLNPLPSSAWEQQQADPRRIQTMRSLWTEETRFWQSHKCSGWESTGR